MEKHVLIVGALHIGYSALEILAAVMIFMFFVGGGLLDRIVGVTGDPMIFPIAASVGGMMTFFLLLVSVPGLVGGIGLLRHKPWARYMVLVLSVLDLVNIPIGISIGIYSIWVLVQDETAELFESTSS
jgi:hypothetical protein